MTNIHQLSKQINMSNYRRTLIAGGVFSFTVVTHDRARIFSSEARVEALRAAFRKIKAVRPFQMDAVVVLPDHLHCLWRLPEGDGDYSGRWREIKKAASRQIDARTNRNCPAAPHLLCQRPAHVQTSTHRRPLSRKCGTAEQLRFRIYSSFRNPNWIVTTNHRNERSVWQRRFWEPAIRDEED
jgi:REP element-mobilizing transposase RayT